MKPTTSSTSSTATPLYGKQKLQRLSKRSIVLGSAIVFLLALFPLYQYCFIGWSRPTTHGMMSSQSIMAKPIDPGTQQLLNERPATFWNCDLAETPCQYFNPHHFFWDSEGAGARFAADKDAYRRLGGNNKNLPAMTALSWHKNEGRKYAALPHNVSFIHIHKCGGTTVQAILAQTKGKLLNIHKIKLSRNAAIEADINTYKYSFGGGSKEQKERNWQRRQDHIEGMLQLQQQQQQRQQIEYVSAVFTVVRDPIERFVSAVQQVMHYHDDFRAACLKWTARSTLKCAIQYIQETDYLRDVHLLPMVTHFRLWNDYGPNKSDDNNKQNNQDSAASIKIAVLHLDDIHILANYMATMVAATLSSSTNMNTTTFTTMPHGRDRSKVEYATSSILAHMSVSKDCTPDMIANLCRLYAIDVAFMASLGYASSYCNGAA